MRKIIICFLLSLVHLNSFSQQPNPEVPLTAEDYRKKSERQESTGLILLIGGLAVFVTGALLPGSELDNCNDPFCIMEDLSKEGIKATLKVAGGLSTIGSIPFFIESDKNRRKAALLTLNIEKTINNKRNLVHTPFPAVGIKITF